MKETAGGIAGEQFTFSMKFKTNRAINQLLDSISQIGTLDVNCMESPMRSDHADSQVRSFRDMSVAVSEVVKVPAGFVSGSAFLPDGRLVLVQHKTAKILLLDRDMVVTSELGLPPQPWDVAVTGDTEVTVSVPWDKKLQFVTVGTAELRLCRTITTERNCWGVGVHNDHIYVTLHDNPGNGCVNVMDMAGAVSQRIAIKADGQGLLHCPSYIAASHNRVYVTDRGTGIISCYTPAGAQVYRLEVGTKERLRGILPDVEGNMLVCYAGSHKVQFQKPDGTRHNFIVVKSPESISYRGNDDTLVVTSNRDPYLTAIKMKVD